MHQSRIVAVKSQQIEAPLKSRGVVEVADDHDRPSPLRRTHEHLDGTQQVRPSPHWRQCFEEPQQPQDSRGMPQRRQIGDQTFGKGRHDQPIVFQKTRVTKHGGDLPRQVEFGRAAEPHAGRTV